MAEKRNSSAKKPVKKNYRPLITVSIIVGILVIIVLFFYFSNRVVESAPGTIGNSAGNLYNGGLFCENDGRIYFSNHNDDYALYSMSSSLKDFKKIYNDYCRYINCDENYVYYTRKNNKKENPTQSIFIFFSTGVYRVKKNGTGMKMITQDPSGSLLLYDNKLYYQVYRNNSLTLYRSGIDGNDEIKILSDDTPVVSAYEGRVYYAGNLKEHDVHYITPSGSVSLAFEANAYLPIATAQGMYYISTVDKKYRIYLADMDGSNEQCIVEKPVSWYNVTEDGRYVFYQCDEKEESALYVLDREENTTETILEGNYKWINLAGGYCFFFEFSTERAYAYDYTKKVLSYFNPPTK